MLNTVRLRSIYSKIQTQLFYMIPEKWESIYLYASIEQKMNRLETGEMFFYYYPKGILKKNPVNVYEVPTKFNIDEEAYIKLVNKLYDTIKLLRVEYEKAGEKLWSNLTICIENLKFKIEYNYDNLQNSKYSNYDRHVIWKYKYLNMGLDRFSKRDRKMLEQYILEEQFENKQTINYSENMYIKNVHNIVEYNKEEKDEIIEDDDLYKKDFYINEKSKNKLDKYETYKKMKQQQNKKEKKIELEDMNIEIKRKNQILNF